MFLRIGIEIGSSFLVVVLKVGKALPFSSRVAVIITAERLSLDKPSDQENPYRYSGADSI